MSSSSLSCDVCCTLLQFADHEAALEPLYQAICRLAAKDDNIIKLMEQAPPLQRKATLLLAALHERVLSGEAPELAVYYPSAGGEFPNTKDEQQENNSSDSSDSSIEPSLRGLSRALSLCVSRHTPVLLSHLRHGATQTNEVARCAVLWPAMAHIAESTGNKRIALMDLGCSGGLNLGLDHYNIRYFTDAVAGQSQWQQRGPEKDGKRAEIESLWLGSAVIPSNADWHLEVRQGVDPSPIDVADPLRLRWLSACLWPHDASRRERLKRAAEQFHALPVTLTQSDDCIGAIEPWLASLPAGVQPVLMTSWVLFYMNAADLARLRATVGRLAESHGLVWLCGDLPYNSSPAGPHPPMPALPASEATTASVTLWTLRHYSRASGRVEERALAYSHPHGRWVAWLDNKQEQK